MRPRISAVLPTLGSHATLARVLDGFSGQDAPPASFEVVVATDVAEPDVETVERLMAARPFPVRRVSGEVPGPSANRNAGWTAAEGELILFLDNDTIPTHRLVSEHLRWHHRYREEQVGVLGRVRWAPEIEVTPFMRWLDTGIQFDYANIKGTDAGWGRFYSANCSVKRSFVERVGGFDQARLPYGYEDTDWAYRASKRGFRLMYNRRALVDHLRPMTLEFFKKRVRRVAEAERRFTDIYPELPPWFHRVYSEAMAMPPARGRGIKLAPYVPRWVPWLGPRVWLSVDVAYKQALAPHFLDAWEKWEDRSLAQAAPDLSEWEAARSRGPSPSGPK